MVANLGVNGSSLIAAVNMNLMRRLSLHSTAVQLLGALSESDIEDF